MQTFQSTYASAIGQSHQRMAYNNQDAVQVIASDPNAFIGVVADGCGSKSNSEVGAQLAVRFVAEEIARMIRKGKNWQDLLQRAHESWAERFVNAQEPDDPDEFIGDCMLYTLLGVVIEDRHTTIFHSGDGVFMVNGNLTVIDQQNQPAYLNYELMEQRRRHSDRIALHFERYHTADIESVLVGTDGVEELEAAFRQEKWSGYPSLVSLCEDNEMYRNPAALPKLLFQTALAEKLYDDTSLVMLKRG